MVAGRKGRGKGIVREFGTTRKVLELINEYSKVAGYKINTQKSLAFLYIKNEKTEKLRKQFHSPLQQK